MTLEQLREQVCEANLELGREGLVTLTWGNVSGLTADRDALAIKPSGVDYQRMRATDMVLVSLATGETLEGTLRPSSDTPTHRVLYRAFDTVGGVAHTHSTHATAWAQARRELPCLGTTHADHFRGSVPVTRPLTADEVADDYETQTGEVIVERFARLDPAATPGVLVAGHAPFTWGNDAAGAVKNAVALEAVARLALDTLRLDPQATPLEPHVLDKHQRRKHGPDAYYGQPGGDA